MRQGRALDALTSARCEHRAIGTRNQRLPRAGRAHALIHVTRRLGEEGIKVNRKGHLLERSGRATVTEQVFIDPVEAKTFSPASTNASRRSDSRSLPRMMSRASATMAC